MPPGNPAALAAKGTRQPESGRADDRQRFALWTLTLRIKATSAKYILATTGWDTDSNFKWLVPRAALTTVGAEAKLAAAGMIEDQINFVFIDSLLALVLGGGVKVLDVWVATGSLPRGGPVRTTFPSALFAFLCVPFLAALVTIAAVEITSSVSARARLSNLPACYGVGDQPVGEWNLLMSVAFPRGLDLKLAARRTALMD